MLPLLNTPILLPWAIWTLSKVEVRLLDLMMMESLHVGRGIALS